jgi:hypothetical protein
MSGLYILILLCMCALSARHAALMGRFYIEILIVMRFIFAAFTIGFLGMSSRAVVNEKFLPATLMSIFFMNLLADQSLFMAH